MTGKQKINFKYIFGVENKMMKVNKMNATICSSMSRNCRCNFIWNLKYNEGKKCTQSNENKWKQDKLNKNNNLPNMERKY